jgi:Na+-translocating ferredoxin:NAD+ oxidoreductase subunit B
MTDDHFAMPDTTERLDRILPQTQCGQCGYAGCRPYAEAMAAGAADIDRCPPGGDAGARALAHVLGIPAKPFDRTRGLHKPPLVALIVEAACIGCTKCIQACPVDAIIGAAKHMHAVIGPLCTGCELCVPACPVDCIEMVAVPTSSDVQSSSAIPASRKSVFNSASCGS